MAEEHVEIAEAAQRLGLTEGALRKQIRYGRVRTIQFGDELYIPTSELPASPTQESAAVPAEPLATDPLVAALQSEVASLRQQLAVKDRQIEELLAVLQQARGGPPAAPGGETPA